MNAVFSAESSAYISSGRGASVCVRSACVYGGVRARACVCECVRSRAVRSVHTYSTAPHARGWRSAKPHDDDLDLDDDDDFNGDEDDDIVVETTLIEVG